MSIHERNFDFFLCGVLYAPTGRKALAVLDVILTITSLFRAYGQTQKE